jgi:type I restriction enzyme S subunit
MKHKPYPKYKDSGVQWIGEIPGGWAVSKIKFLLKTPVTDGPHETPEFIEEGIPFLSVDSIHEGEIILEDCRYISEEDHLRYKVKCNPQKNDVFMGKAASIGKIARVKVDFPFSIWSPLALLRANKEIQSQFFEYALKSDYSQDQIDIFATSNTQKNISMDDIPRIQLILPKDVTEQTQLVNFLDSKTSQINKTIEKDKQLIELLKEKRTALINHVVTKGLDKNAKMKDSGIDWIGEIPEEWDIKKLKFVARIKTGDKNTEDHIPKGKYPFFVRSQTVERLNTYTFNGEAVLTAGDGVGVGKVFHYYNGKFDFHQRVYAITHFKEVLGKYAYYYLKNNLIKEMLKYNAKSTVDSLRLPMFLNFVMTFPKNIQQQIQIVKYLDKATSKIDNTINTIQEKIILMEEYKKSLIHHVVTGKVDVRGVEA